MLQTHRTPVLPFSAPPPMPSIPHRHVRMWALAAAGVLCQSHPQALAHKAAGRQAAGSQGTAVCRSTSARGGFLFSGTGQKSDNCMIYPVGCLVPLFWNLKSSCQAVLCSLSSCLFPFLLSHCYCWDKSEGKAQAGSCVRLSYSILFGCLQQFPQGLQWSLRATKDNDGAMECHGKSMGKAWTCPWGNKESPPVFSVTCCPCPALVFIILLGWAWSVKESGESEHSAPQPCTTPAAAHEKSPPRTLNCWTQAWCWAQLPLLSFTSAKTN